MRTATLGAIIALLFSALAGRVFATQELVRDVQIIEGDSFSFSVITILHTNVVKCFLEPPQSDIIEFVPNGVSQSTDRFEVLVGDFMAMCQVRVNNIGKHDGGIWTMYYEHPDGKGDSQRYVVTVLPKDVLTTEPPVPEGTILSEIKHFTKKGSLIDISLSKQSFDEECFVVSPKDGNLTMADVHLDGVKVQSSSEFVSCRITIGPMNEDLLGIWSICGTSKTDGNMRCQPASIAWYNSDEPDASWQLDSLEPFQHGVHVGGSVNPGVWNYGDVITCHVITPNKEDLVLTSDAHYPNIERVYTSDTGLCSVIIKVTGLSSLGEWTVYGKFNSALESTEVRLPMYFKLYNESNPIQQAYNITMLPRVDHVVNLGTRTSMEVTGSSHINQCLVTAPSGRTFYKGEETIAGVSFVDVNDAVACRVAIGPITKDMAGPWELIGKFNHNNLFDEKVQLFHIDIEDPANPFEDIHREVKYLTHDRVDTSMNTMHTIKITREESADDASCLIITPNGLQYRLLEGINVDGVEIIKETGVQCGATINLHEEDLLGEWVLLARGIKDSVATEWRVSYTFYVEVQVNAIPQQVNMAAGTDLYVRLEEPTPLFESCKLIGPNGDINTQHVDSLHINSCGYVIKNVSENQSGKWMIVYGNRIIYKAVINVYVSASSAVSVENQTWTLGTPVNTTLGPEDAVYCKLADANGLTIFDSFGRCVIEIERVTDEHQGVWRMSVGMPGTVLLQETAFIVNVNEAVSSPVVNTSVTRVAPSVMLTCSVPSEYVVKGCKFRDHRGNIMLAYHGVGEDVETGAVATSFESEVTDSSCTLRLTNPTAADLGLWRCAVETEEETLYAFLTVTCPWLMQNPEVAASVSLEPTLTQERSNIRSLEGDSTVMSCAIDASIRYCYFRARNGSIFNLRPGHSSADIEYVGAGFHAGECGIRFRNLLATDSGRWSCHVGLFDTSAQEQSQQFEVEVQEKMKVSHYRTSNGELVLEGAVYDNHRVEYCRYIRIDGLGFTSDNVPAGYTMDNALMAVGYCTLVMAEPTMLNMHPWTVVAKLAGVDQEIAKYTVDHIMGGEHVDGDQPGHGGGSGNNSNLSLTLLWISFGLIFLTVASLSMGLLSKKNRRWAASRASEIRNSFRKEPLPTTQNTHSTV